MNRSPDHPVKAALILAIGRLAALRPTRIVGEPDLVDAHGLADDLLAVAAIVDPIVQAIGEYAQSTLGITPADVERYFHDQLRAALEGNATYCITQALAAREDDTAERRRRGCWQRFDWRDDG